MITDDYIKSLYFTKKETVNSNYLKAQWMQKHPEIKSYLDTRYPDSTSYKETLYRILLGIETRPTCKTCGNPAVFEASHRWSRNRNGWPFLKYCSPECQANNSDVINKRKQTCMKKYGADNPAKLSAVKEKMKHTNLDRYGVENVYQSKEIQDKIKRTNLEKYGVENVLQSPEFAKQSYETSMLKYGAKTYSASDTARTLQNVFIQKSKNTCLQKYGVDCYAKTPQFKKYMAAHKEEISRKQYDTKRKNKSFNVSSKEDYLYNILNNHYGPVERQYKSAEYPFACDFYAPRMNLYIEYQGTWTHGPHPYIEEADIDTVELMKKKAGRSPFYKNAIQTWTVRDVRKRNKAEENNLNYLEIYPNIDLDSIPDIINSNYTEGTAGKHLVVGTV